MEGRISTYKKVLADFESRLHGAEFVAIDTELTGVDIAGEPDTFEETAQMRVEKHCRIAERYALIQVGFTIVSRKLDGTSGQLSCASYNLFAFPYMGPELLGREPGFFCQASALQFNAQHRVDFNKWVREGIPYVSREDEDLYFKNKENGTSEKKAGLLQFWKLLCKAQIPLIVHCPLDLFFLLSAFERRVLPRDAQELVHMIRKCTPTVYDTAHLHGALGTFKRLALLKFHEDAKAKYEEIREDSGMRTMRPKLEFILEGETQSRYGKQEDTLAHEAGFDSLLTAQLFAYLREISPGIVRENANRLFLYRSCEYIDLARVLDSGAVGTNMFDLARVTLVVAALDPWDATNVASLIASAGVQYKWMDGRHLLVVLRASGGAAVRKAAELAGQVRGVVAWMGFEEWKAAQAAAATSHPIELGGRIKGSYWPTGEDDANEDPRAWHAGPMDLTADIEDTSDDADDQDDDDDDDSVDHILRHWVDHDANDDDPGEWTVPNILAAATASATASVVVAMTLLHGRSHAESMVGAILRRLHDR